jgi:hypothetical protein
LRSALQATGNRDIHGADTKSEGAMAVEIIVPLENKPGTLAKAAEVLGKAGVNLQGIGYSAGARGFLRVVADNPDKAMAALKKAKIKGRQGKEVIEMTLADTPGALAEVARKLAKSRINIEAFYVAGEGSRGLRCVFAVDNPQKAQKVLAG